jgi:hypothetical protein
MAPFPIGTSTVSDGAGRIGTLTDVDAGTGVFFRTGVVVETTEKIDSSSRSRAAARSDRGICGSTDDDAGCGVGVIVIVPIKVEVGGTGVVVVVVVANAAAYDSKRRFTSCSASS